MKRLFNAAAEKLAFHIFDMSIDMFIMRTLFILFKLLYTVETLACMPIRVADVARSPGSLEVWTQTQTHSQY